MNVETKQIKIGGAVRPFRMSFAAFAQLERKAGVQYTNVQSYLTEGGLMAQVMVIYCALWAGIINAGGTADFDENDVLRWIDEEPDSFAVAMAAIAPADTTSEAIPEAEAVPIEGNGE